MEAAKKMLRPGTMMADYHREVGKLMTEELITLKLITREDVKKENADWPAHKSIFKRTELRTFLVSMCMM